MGFTTTCSKFMTDHPKTSKSCAESRTDLCTGGRNVPQIQGTFMHGVQKRASDSGDIYAQDAETCLSFRGHLCTGCRNMPQIQDRLLPGVHSLPRVLGQINQDENGKLRESGGTVLHSMGYVYVVSSLQ